MQDQKENKQEFDRIKWSTSMKELFDNILVLFILNVEYNQMRKCILGIICQWAEKVLYHSAVELIMSPAL